MVGALGVRVWAAPPRTDWSKDSRSVGVRTAPDASARRRLVSHAGTRAARNSERAPLPGRGRLPRQRQTLPPNNALRAKPLLAHFGADRLATDVTAGDLKAYRDTRLDAKLEPATVNRELSCLRRGFNLARRDGSLNVVPVFPMLEEDNVRTGFFEEHERRALVDALPAGVDALAAFLSLTDWRLSETLSLTWAQVDFPAGVIRLEPGTTKNSEGRTFPFARLPELATLMGSSRPRRAAWSASKAGSSPWSLSCRRGADLAEDILSTMVGGGEGGRNLPRGDRRPHGQGQARAAPPRLPANGRP